MPPRDRRPFLALCSTALVLTSATVLACSNGAGGAQHQGYANDGDTGAAAPATQQTLSPNPAMGDSTTGLQGRTGEKMMAGDSGRPTVNVNGQPAPNAVPSRPITGESSGAAGYLRSGGQQRP